MIGNKQLMHWAGTLIAIPIFLWLATVLPRTTAELFASPDETAVMAFARAWTVPRGFSLPARLPETLKDAVSLHPRSMVRQGESLVPVGFLGMPFLAMLAERFGRGYGAYLTALLVLSSTYPLWHLARRVSGRFAASAVLFLLSFPVVILYANRGLFPNLPVVALALWSVWAWSGLRRACPASPAGWRQAGGKQKAVCAGVTLGLALTIRPTEALWLIPWIFWAIWSGGQRQTSWRPYILGAVVTLLVTLGGAWLSYQTYPSQTGWLPAIGYQLRDAINTSVDAPRPTPHAPRSPFTLPFGFHPRVMWENVRVYFFNYFALWTAAALLGFVLALKRHWTREMAILGLLTGWTVIVLLVLYGQSIYGDNIRGHASLGNSFLRYLLPLVPLMSLGMAYAVETIRGLVLRGRLLAAVLIGFFVLYGVATAWNGDEEGLKNTQRELRRYTAIRAQAEQKLSRGTIIISERSDKIFASGPFVAVSPLPDGETLQRLRVSGAPTALFHRMLTAEETGRFNATSTVFEVDNEVMYRLN